MIIVMMGRSIDDDGKHGYVLSLSEGNEHDHAHGPQPPRAGGAVPASETKSLMMETQCARPALQATTGTSLFTLNPNP